MVQNETEIVRLFLQKKPGYMKCGAAKIANAIRNKQNIVLNKNTLKQCVKEAKKQIRRGFKNQPEFKVDVINNPEKFIADFKKIAAKMGLTLTNTEDNPQDIKSVISKRRKKTRLTFNVPSISDQIGIHILVGCNHVPFHNVQMHRGIIELINDYKKNIMGFHLMGDFLDMNPLSSHDRGRFTSVPGLTLDDEYFVGNEVLDDFDRALPKNCWKTYLYGNHEDRYNRWMSVMDNAKTPLASPEDALGLERRGYQVKTNWSQDYITIGNDFDIFHGIYFNIHNAKKHLDTFNRNCAYVHTHRTQMYREGRLAAHNIGAGADFTQKAFNYATRAMKASWSNGFAVLMVDATGATHLTQVYVDQFGRFYFGGKKY